MATTTYGPIYGSTVKDYWKTYLYITVNTTYSNTSSSITFKYGITWVKQIKGNADNDGNYQTVKDRPSVVSCTTQTSKNFYPTGTLTRTWYDNGNRSYQEGSGTFYINRTKSSQSITVKASITHAATSTTYKGTSSASKTVTIPARPSYKISFNGNAKSGTTINNMPSSITKYYEYDATLPSTKPYLTLSGTKVWEFSTWNTNSGGTGTNYKAGALYGGNTTATLYALWAYTNPSISGVSLRRGTYSNSTFIADDEAGTWLELSFKYTRGHLPSSSPTISTTINTYYIPSGSSTVYYLRENNSSTGPYSFTYTSGTSGTFKKYFPISSLSNQASHTIRITLTETAQHSVTYNLSLSSVKYPIELASDASLMTLGVPTKCKSNLYILSGESGADDLMTFLSYFGWSNTYSNE